MDDFGFVHRGVATIICVENLTLLFSHMGMDKLKSDFSLVIYPTLDINVAPSCDSSQVLPWSPDFYRS